MTTTTPVATLPMGDVVRRWWPLAGSWLLMAAELPAVGAALARLAEPKINLAAYGGIVFPLALIIEAPVIMLLAASTALCRDEASYRLVRRFMMISGAALTLVHIAVSFTPLYDVIIGRFFGSPMETREAGRIGMQLMTPWTWSIAYRRFQQGLLIHAGRPGVVGAGTMVRLFAGGTLMVIGVLVGDVPGIIVATTAVSTAVIAEAAFVGIRVRPVARALAERPRLEPPLTNRTFTQFYTPLALTSLITLLGLPIVSAALGRMPRAVDSLAVWPVLNGLVFTLRSMGFAYNEVVVALLDRPGAEPALRRFAIYLAGSTSLLLLLIAATPAARFWFQTVTSLTPDLGSLAHTGLWIAFLMPALSVMQSFYQGTIVHSKKTGGITESVIIYLVTISAILGAGIFTGAMTGLFVGLVAGSLGNVTQNSWLWFRARGIRPARA